MRSIRIELHCHTYHSADSLMRPARLVELCRRRSIQRLAITDHNSIAGAQEAAALDPELVIVGEEIETAEGELLGYFLQEQIPAGLAPAEAIARLRDQGAFISVSHPCDRFRNGAWKPEALQRILPLVDALEAFNSRTMKAADNQAAEEIAAGASLLATAGSDAHAYVEVGRSGMLTPPFTDAAGMKRALAEGQIVRRLSSPLVHFLSRYAKWRKLIAPPGVG
jgi:predicted metal-dependent phosphoesterase TrpH